MKPIPIGTKLSVIGFNAIAMAVHHKWTVTGAPQPQPPGSTLRIGVGKPMGKRKEFHIVIDRQV